MGFNCDQCGASYPVRKSLTNHKKLKHSNAKQFTYKQCTYVTTKKDHYEQYVRWGGRQGFQQIVDSTTFPCVHLHFYKKKKT